MKEKKKSLTAAEEVKFQEILQKHVALQTEQPPKKEIVRVINKFWKMQGYKNPKVLIADSPFHANKIKNKIENGGSMVAYWSGWYASCVAMCDFCQNIDLDVDKSKYNDLYDWVYCCPYILFNETDVIVSKKPIEVHFNDMGQLHNESGKSIKFSDGWGTWTLNGVRVDKQIVMSPETQTMEQINKEGNEEVKRIRIERYGWVKYLENVNAKLIDYRDNTIENNTEEQLYDIRNGERKVLVCLCPSTGKRFCLEVSPEVTTCEEAQSLISHGFSSRIISSS